MKYHPVNICLILRAFKTSRFPAKSSLSRLSFAYPDTGWHKHADKYKALVILNSNPITFFVEQLKLPVVLLH